MDKDQFLAHIRQQLDHAELPQAAAKRPAPLTLDPAPSPPDLLEMFVTELTAVNGVAYVVDSDEAALAQLEAIFEEIGARGYLGWDDEHLPVADLHNFLTARGYKRGQTALAADHATRKTEQQGLAELEIGVTGALAAIAATGTILLQNGDGRGRFASLLPTVHVAIITAEQLVPTLQHFVRANPDVNRHSANVVAITGPSRTGDIGGVLTLGVHGPQELHVIVKR